MLSGVLSVSLLVFFAKILAGVFSRIGLPVVLGELFAGIIFGPYAVGSLIVISGHKLIELNEIVLVFSQIGAILILFAAGLEMTFSEFRAAGLRSFVVGGFRGSCSVLRRVLSYTIFRISFLNSINCWSGLNRH